MRYSWLLIVLLSMTPLWLYSMFARGYWTPDEPREADMAWHMSQSAVTHQGDWVLPELGGHKFLEKPPLSYWFTAASFKLFGQSSAAARVPNVLYVVIAVVSIGLMVQAMAGTSMGMLAAMLFASMFETLRVSIWLAPDACLLAGCAMSLLGAYRGYIAQDDSAKLKWYTLMHAGALWGFMAKSAIGWLVPGLALLILIAWERRWRELVRPQLWAGLLLQVVVIGIWVDAVFHQADGANDLRVLFWNNLMGRFAHIHAPAAIDYAAAHQNWPGKYLAELPYYIFPWCLLLIGALRRAWRLMRAEPENRQAAADRTTWRFALASWLPFAILISLSATARDVYFAPALIGISATIALWVRDVGTAAGKFDVWMLRATRYLVVLLVLLVLIILVLLSMTELRSDRQLVWIALSITALAAVGWMACRRAASAQRSNQYPISIAWCYLVTIMTLTIAMLTAVPVVNRWQNLGAIATSVKRDAGEQPLAVLHPDETTIAMLDYHSDLQITALNTPGQSATQMINDWFRQYPRAHVLVLLPGHAPGAMTALLERHKRIRQPGDGVVDELINNHAAMIAARYELPMGRRYAMLVAPLHAEGKAP